MLICYLDSQDYSTLTDPKTVTAENVRIRDALLSYARTGQVGFAFSAAVVSEAVPLTPNAAHLAELKAEFLGILCGTNALISFDRLVFREMVSLAERSVAPSGALDPHGHWLPSIPSESNPRNHSEMIQEVVEEAVNAPGLSRQQRRAAVRKHVKNGKPRGALKAVLAKQDVNGYAANLAARYPMSARYAEVMTRYALGRASEEEFNIAFTQSLIDPAAVMKWFGTEHALSSPVAEIVRKPGRDLGEMMRSLVEISGQLASKLNDLGLDDSPFRQNGALAKQWSGMVEAQLVRMAQRIGEKSSGKYLIGFTAADVDIYCPGLSACVRSLFSSVWDNIGGSRKEPPSNSQPVDALHALYAPYVDVFRADRFMAPHIQRHVAHRGTRVVPKLAQILSVIDELLTKRS